MSMVAPISGELSVASITVPLNTVVPCAHDTAYAVTAMSVRNVAFNEFFILISIFIIIVFLLMQN